ncbi:TIGR02996 domain-containing protein [Limnoglobus roseus]|uniref:TIGR02996 domain-containing protein n=1 Tax=Limnoglobus roseus TaxID=2598579 RepID=A0A5C1AMB8_9BACT|nr:TIGR02996 domain-containing protein [Limnoglobus roseus]QEL18048.1 TIGR02996 domain-containing protein [Limnoglobus roseus]
MTDHDALLNAIISEPDDDTARLVYADFIEEAGEPERAAFIREQIELARVPDWEPLAVRYRRADLPTQAGDRFRSSLPWADGWNPRFPFRRGFGYAVKTTAVRHLIEFGEQLFASAPLGELHLPGGDMMEYREFAAQPWLPHVRSVRFWLSVTPTEPVRALCASPLSTGVQAIHFEKASSPGMSFLVEGLFQSPLGRQLRELSFRVGDGSQLDLIEAFEAGGPTNLERLAFDNMGLDLLATERFSRSPVLETLRELTFRNMFFSAAQFDLILRSAATGLDALTFRNMGYRPRNRAQLSGLAGLKKFRTLKRLDLTGSYGLRNHLHGVCVKSLRTLRSLGLGGITLDEVFLRQLVQAPCWPNLVELDLSENALTDLAAGHLLTVPRPPELTTLDLRGNPSLPPRVREELHEHFGPAMLFD